MVDDVNSSEFERKLAELRPNGDSLNHDRIMFLAGRESAPPLRRSPWIAATAGMSLLSAALSVVVVWQSQQASSLTTPSMADHAAKPPTGPLFVAQPNESVIGAADLTPVDKKAVTAAATFPSLPTDQERHYLRLREQVIRKGIDAWPTVRPARNHESPVSPLQPRSSMYQRLNAELQILNSSSS